VTYSLEVSEEARAQIDTLPDQVAAALAEVWAFLEITPWAGTARHDRAPVRQVDFADGAGLVTYLILEDQRIVEVLLVLWL
jgi:hypothetical protein